jgi:undecaprenyl-diphosphatase
MSIFQIILLGIVQGITEFLPISSSGHLVIFEKLLKIGLHDISLEVFLHFGTILAVIYYFRKDLLKMLNSIGERFSGSKENQESWEFIWLIIIGTIPAVILGLLFKENIEKSFTSVKLVGITLTITGIFLWLSRFSKQTKAKISWLNAVIIGFSQALAMLPGISRSGATITAGLFLGIEKEKSAKFSFLLSLPAVLGASLLKLKDSLSQGICINTIFIYLVGMVTAFIFGYFSIAALLKILKKGKFEYFGYYCLLVGVLVFIFL